MAGFTRLGKQLTQSFMNTILDAIELHNARQHGKGVLDGLELSAGDDFDVEISAGSMLGYKGVDLGGTSYTLPASSTRYVFIDEDGLVTVAATSEDPGGTAVCLGRVATDGAGIISVDTDGRQELARWVGGTFKIGRNISVDQQTGDMTTAGKVTARIEAVGHLRMPVNTTTLTADLTLTPDAANIQWLKASGADRAVLLPADADSDPGMWFDVVNAGNPAVSAENHDLILQTAAGDPITGGTIAPGNKVRVRTAVASGDVGWPADVAAYPAEEESIATP